MTALQVTRDMKASQMRCDARPQRHCIDPHGTWTNRRLPAWFAMRMHGHAPVRLREIGLPENEVNTRILLAEIANGIPDLGHYRGWLLRCRRARSCCWERTDQHCDQWPGNACCFQAWARHEWACCTFLAADRVQMALSSGHTWSPCYSAPAGRLPPLASWVCAGSCPLQEAIPHSGYWQRARTPGAVLDTQIRQRAGWDGRRAMTGSGLHW